MKKLLESAERLRSKFPYELHDSPDDSIFLVFILPFLLGYVAVIVLAHIV
jgi:hypothetical protein